MTFIKKVINSNPGDADHWGGNDIDRLDNYFDNVDITPAVAKINTRTYFRSGKLELRNPADTFSYVFIGSALAADRNVTLPLLASNDTLAFNSFAATLSNKTLDATCDVSAAAGATGAPVAARYVTMATHASLTNEEVLTASDGIALVSGGAGGNTTLASDRIDMARKRVGFIEDFFGSDDTNNIGAYFLKTASGTAAATYIAAVAETGVFGVGELYTGTDTTGAAGIKAGHLSSFSLGQGVATIEMYVKLPTLSALAQEYIFRIGFGDSSTGTVTDGAIFLYDRLASVNWLMQCKSNGTSTQTATSTAVGTGWTRLKIVVNAAGTSAEFFIAGSSVGTIATNVPTGAGRELTIISSIIKSAGTSGRLADIDYIAIDYDLTVSR